jgi:methionine sulfoxide reductase heme-binding subunit
MRRWLFFSALFSGTLVASTGMLVAIDPGHIPWIVSRATGIVAFALLTGSMLLGLCMSTRLASRILPKVAAYEIHAFVSVLTLLFVFVHAGALLFDGYIGFGPASILLPFASAYRPLATGIGIVAAWVLVAVTVSTWLRPRLSYKAWRSIHYLSFGVWAAGLVHGVLAGTDTANPLVAQLYWSSAAAVAGLLTFRVLSAIAAGKRTRPESSPATRSTGGMPLHAPSGGR